MNLPVEDQKIAHKKFALSEEWKRVSVSLANILIDSMNSYNCVNQLNWDLKASSDDSMVEVWLDDVELIGGDRLSIWEK